MDSYDSFGLCEDALDYHVEIELPDESRKQYQFHSRYTVDKIKSIVVQDNNTILKKTPNDYILTIEGERIEIDFSRFIVSHPKITDILARDPLVKVKLITKQSITNTAGGSTLFLSNQSIKEVKEIVTPSINISDLKLNLEKSPVISRIANGSKPISPLASPELKPKKLKDPSHSSILLTPTKKDKDKEKEKSEKKEKKEKKDKLKIDLLSLDNNSSTSSILISKSSKDSTSPLSSSSSSIPLTQTSENSSSGNGTPISNTPTKILGSPLKSFLNSFSDSKKKSTSFLSKKPMSSDDLHYATIRSSNLQRPKTQEFLSPSISLNQVLEDDSSGNVQENGSRSPSPLQYELLNDYSLINESKGFIVEPQRIIKSQSFHQNVDLDSLITDDNWYCKYFIGNEHWNYIGEDEKLGTYIISITRDTGGFTISNSDHILPTSSNSNLTIKGTITRHGSFLSSSGGIQKIMEGNGNSGSSNNDKKILFKALLRTKTCDSCKTVSVKGLSSSFFTSSNKPPVKDIIHDGFSQDISCKNLKSIKNPNSQEAITKDLVKFEQNQKIKSFKFGILYCAPNQTEEEDMFSNEHGSKAFNEFIGFLGQKIELNGWKDYRGGLDVKSDSTGTHSCYQKYKGFEVMFHVSTLLPHSKVDKQQVDKKRHIGNDIVVIIFKEGNQTFDPKVMKSDFNHVFIVIQPQLHTPGTYKVSIGYKDGVPNSLPFLESPSIWSKNQDFKDFLYTKLINSECASYQAPSFKIKIQRTRLTLLKDISNTYIE